VRPDLRLAEIGDPEVRIRWPIPATSTAARANLLACPMRSSARMAKRDATEGMGA